MPLLSSEIKGKLCLNFTSLKCCLLQAWLLQEFLTFIKLKISNEKQRNQLDPETRGAGFCLFFKNLIIVYKKERMHKNREGELGLCFRAKLSPKLPSSAERALQQHLSLLKRKGENDEKAEAKEVGRTMNHLLG